MGVDFSQYTVFVGGAMRKTILVVLAIGLVGALGCGGSGSSTSSQRVQHPTLDQDYSDRFVGDWTGTATLTIVGGQTQTETDTVSVVRTGFNTLSLSPVCPGTAATAGLDSPDKFTSDEPVTCPPVTEPCGPITVTYQSAMGQLATNTLTIAFKGTGSGCGRTVDVTGTFTGTLPPPVSPPPACTSFTYSDLTPAVCPASGEQTRTVATSSPAGCTGGSPVLTQTCTPAALTCTSFTYSDLTPAVCPPSGQQTRTVVSASPAGCTGGSPVLTVTCTPPSAAFDFNGTWAASSTITESNLPNFPVGKHGTDTFVITQSGTTISAVMDGDQNLSGTCDPEAGTFTMRGSSGSAVTSVSMQKVDADSLSGQMTITGGVYLVRLSSTMTLTSRSKAESTTASLRDTTGPRTDVLPTLIEALRARR